MLYRKENPSVIIALYITVDRTNHLISHQALKGCKFSSFNTAARENERQRESVCVCVWACEMQRNCFNRLTIKLLMHQTTENKHFGIIWLKTALVLFE